jgi:two-component system, OmpR family, response regulator
VSRGTCLVIENDEDIAGLITMILNKQGFDVHAVRTGAAALRRASRLNPALVIVEAILPDTDGMNIVRDLRNVTQAPLLMLTARAAADDELSGLAAGASIYLTKPFRIHDLRTAVNELCPSRVDSMSVVAGVWNALRPIG